MNQLKGKLIAFEGIDGAGKSTQIRRLSEWLQSQGIEDICVTAEPTKGYFGRQIREAKERLSPKVERQLFVDDRKEHLVSCILPAIERGAVVLTDRYFYSSIAYQGTRRDAFDHEPTLEELCALQDEIGEYNRLFAPEADILVYVRLDVDVALERMKRGRESLDPFEKRQTLVDVANAFDRVAASHPHAIIVDGSKSPEDITDTIIRSIQAI